MAGRALRLACCVEDLRMLARARVPKPFYDYVDAGSWSEATYQANERDLASVLLRQKVLVNIEQRSVRSAMLGQPVAMPLALAPCGFGGMMWRDGEIAAAQAAEEFGVPFTLSTMSINSIEDVAENTRAPFMFQLYVMRDRGYVKNLISRAKAARCSALVLTADLQVIGQRHKDIKNGLTLPPEPSLQSLGYLLSRPQWCLSQLSAKRWNFGNIIGHHPMAKSMMNLAEFTSAQFDPTLNWQDVEWIKNEWGGKLVIKGIMDRDDAMRAVSSGADALVVSNHGGRQLDGAPSSIQVLPEIAEAVAGQGTPCEVWLDGGVRSGQDILRARALGAHGVLAGRLWLYGLGAGGREGVLKALQIVHKELDVTMGLCGVTDIEQVNSDVLYRS